MNKVNLGKSGLMASEITLGCMRMNKLSVKESETMIRTALDEGVDFFDHATVYGSGECEELFGKAVDLKSSLRDEMIIQSKIGIRRGAYFDFSKEYLIDSVDGSLKRLGTDHLDVVLLHRPDALMEPEEVAEAFTHMKATGKVRYFGVSNLPPMTIELLNKYLTDKLIVNQLQFSITNCSMVASTLTMNMEIPSSVDRDNGILDYCRLKDITIQAWSPFQYGFFDGVFLDNEKFPELNKVIDRIAQAHQVTNSAIAVAWILRHPAKMQTIVGTMNTSRLRDICKASGVKLTREEWYDIYKAAGNMVP
ncbi:aldo/keto reductase [Hydrogenoanaerobacterium sp.]|uniref:aldo/keto reductase n=1 Tax=Hydrogenoanaerobacterium sp. TaxID=2953763 RepID=UPI00289FB82A|nr:aldo/keto reductase [Hydrogenoanaerobacterium sp.]